MTLRQCKGCELYLPCEENFYKAVKDYYQSRCKKCHNASRDNFHRKKTPNKPSGIMKLPEDTRISLLTDVKNKVPFRIISKTYKINYHTLNAWRKAKKI